MISKMYNIKPHNFHTAVVFQKESHIENHHQVEQGQHLFYTAEPFSCIGLTASVI